MRAIKTTPVLPWVVQKFRYYNSLHTDGELFYVKYKTSIIASKRVNRKDVSRWGIFDLKKINKNSFHINDVIEKPSIKNATSNYAVIGRYILPKNIFNILKNQGRGKGGEIHITDAIKTLIQNNFKFVGHKFSGKYMDCGTMKGYIKSTLEINKI